MRLTALDELASVASLGNPAPRSKPGY